MARFGPEVKDVERWKPVVVDSKAEPVKTFEGRRSPPPPADAAPPPIILEASTWIHQSPAVRRPVRVTATARSREQDDRLATTVVRQLAECTLGDPARFQAVARVEADALEDGVVRIEPAGDAGRMPPAGRPRR